MSSVGASGVGAAAFSATSGSLAAALQAALGAMAEVFAILCCGVLAYRQGILSPQILSSVSALTVGLFIPALMVGNVSHTVAQISTSGIGSTLVLAPLCALVQIGLQWLVSNLLLRHVAGVDAWSAKGRILRVAMCWPNSALPLIFCDALFRGHLDGTLVLARGTLAFYLIGWSTMFWSGAFRLLECVPRLPNEEASDTEAEIVAKPSTVPPSRGSALRILLSRVLSPPVCGILVGLTIGLLPPLRWLLVQEASRPWGGGAVFAPILSAIEGLGNAAVPCSTIVLAGSLARGLQDKLQKRRASQSLKSGSILNVATSWGLKEIVSVVLARGVVSPVLSGFGLCYVLRSFGFLPASTHAGRVLAFILLCEAAMPPAQNSVVIPNMLGRPQLGAAMAELLLIVYMIILPCASLWLALALCWSGV